MSARVDRGLLSITGYTDRFSYAPAALELAHREVTLQSHGIVDRVHLPAPPLD